MRKFDQIRPKKYFASDYVNEMPNPCDARPPLHRALDLAHRAGAAQLAERARAELIAAGARPRRAALTGPDALTTAERRVAGLAALGRGNRQIAQQLFITLPTVETHLRHVYRKLGITSRAGLASRLGPQAGPQPTLSANKAPAV